jgi:hypothetical protein
VPAEATFLSDSFGQYYMQRISMALRRGAFAMAQAVVKGIPSYNGKKRLKERGFSVIRRSASVTGGAVPSVVAAARRCPCATPASPQVGRVSSRSSSVATVVPRGRQAGRGRGSSGLHRSASTVSRISS